MKLEIINQVLLNESGELLLCLESGGQPMYQYVYREAAGVYWDSENGGFKSTELKSWSCPKWFSHLVTIAEQVGIELKLSQDATWKNLTDHDINEIMKTCHLKRLIIPPSERRS